MRFLRIACYGIAVTLAMTQLAFVAAVVVGNQTDHRLVIVTGGSMEPVFRIGDGLLVARERHPRPGEVVTFRSPTGILVTHRIVSLHTVRGALYMQTKGDANQAADPDFSPVAAIVGRPVSVIPYGGYVASFLTSPVGRLVTYGPALLVLLVLEVGGMWRNRPRRHAAAHSSTEARGPLWSR